MNQVARRICLLHAYALVCPENQKYAWSAFKAALMRVLIAPFLHQSTLSSLLRSLSHGSYHSCSYIPGPLNTHTRPQKHAPAATSKCPYRKCLGLTLCFDPNICAPRHFRSRLTTSRLTTFQAGGLSFVNNRLTGFAKIHNFCPF